MKKLFIIWFAVFCTSQAFGDITPLPDPPQRTDPTNFATKADAFLGALPTFATEANALATTVNGYKTDAETAQAAAEAAQAVAQTSANFKGNWSDQTGAAAIPYSVYHEGNYWQLVSNLADVTASEPGVTAAWKIIGGVILADDLDQLQSFSVVEGAVVYLKGRTTAGDGGQGVFVGKAGDFTAEVTADTLSGIYAPSDTDSDGSDGCWVRQLNGYTSPEMFGDIKTAIEFGGVIKCDGAYTITDEITAPDNTIILGNGWGTTITQTTREKNILILNDYCKVSGIHFIGDGLTTGIAFEKNNGCYTAGAKGFTIEDCFFEGFESGGIQLRNVSDYTIRNNILFNNQWGAFATAADIVLYSSAACGRGCITGNKCYSNNSQGIWVDALGFDSSLIVSNNICITLDPATCIEGGSWSELASGSVTRRHGIMIGYAGAGPLGNILITDNACANTLWTGIYKPLYSAGPTLITNNLIRDVGYQTSNSLSGGIFVGGGGNVSLIDNSVDNFRNTDDNHNVGAITMVGTSASPDYTGKVSRNTITNSASYGIALATYSKGVDASENRISNSAYEDISVLLSSGSATAGGHIIRRNLTNRNNADEPSIYVSLGDSTRDLILDDNELIGYDSATTGVDNSGIYLNTSIAGVKVRRNSIKNFQNAVHGAVFFTGGRLFDRDFSDNSFDTCVNGWDLSQSVTTNTFPISGTKYLSVTSPIVSSLGNDVVIDAIRTGLFITGYDSAVPTTGTWLAGDRIINSTPTVGQPKSWVCTVGGNSGTWVSEGNL